MHAGSFIGVQAVAVFAHASVAVIASRHHKTNQKSFELTTSATSIGSVLHLITLVECSSGLYSTLAAFPILIPMIVIPMVTVDITTYDKLGMKKSLQVLSMAMVSLCLLSVQLLYMLPRHHDILAINAVTSLAIFCAVFAVERQRFNPQYKEVLFSLPSLALPLLMILQICIPYLMYKQQNIAVLLTAPIISSITVTIAGLLICKLTMAESEAKRSSILHTISHVLRRSDSVKGEEIETELPTADSKFSMLSRRSMSEMSTTSEGREPTEPKLYNEGYATDNGSEPGQDLTTAGLDHHDVKSDEKPLGRLVPFSFELAES